MTEQLSLFETKPSFRVQQADKPLMSQEGLIKWKSKILNYQQKSLTQQSPKQTSLFGTKTTHCDVDNIRLVVK